MSDRDRFRRIEALFNEALALPDGQRNAYLERECADDTALLAEVCELLSRDRTRSVGTNIVSSVSFVDEAPADLAGQRIGAYRLVRELGAGGMGTVYLAARENDDFEQRVAIKVVHNRLSSEIAARFRTEQQILASLEHPNIARLLDGGTTADGYSYVVMEYVDGSSITEYSDAARLSVRERLRLFLDICEAVQYAHKNLIVHRDLKPQNVLVSSGGDVKLLDFGIAKLLESGLPAATGEATVHRRLTPDYASPEQITGGAITTASDVYSLGVMLYELLAGCQPYHFAATSSQAMDREIQEISPTRPSAAIENADSRASIAEHRNTTAERLARTLSGDLDNIVLMAMRKESERRYPTPAAFADDIRDYLAERPVIAREDTWRYRAGKFVRRNRVGVATAAVLLATVAVAAVVSANFAIRESRQRALAEQRFDDVRDLATTFIYEVHDSIATEGRTAARNLLIETGLKYLDALERQRAGVPELELDLARGYVRMARIQGDVSSATRGEVDAALASAEQGRALIATLDPALDPLAVNLLQAEAQQVLGSLARHRATLADSVAHFEEALRLRYVVNEQAPDRALDTPRVDEILRSYGSTLEYAGRYEDALAQYEAQLAELERLAERFPANDDFVDSAQVARAAIGQTYQRLGEFETARRILEDLKSDLGAPTAGGARRFHSIQTAGSVRANLGRVYDALGMRDEAEAELLAAFDINTTLSALDPDDVMMRRRVYATHHFLGKLYDNQNEPEKALAEFEEMLDVAREITDREPESLTFKRNYAVALDMNGFALRKLSRNAEALVRHEEANSLFAELAAAAPDNVDWHRSVAVSWYFLGQLHRELALQQPAGSDARQGRLADAVRSFTAARDIMIALRDQAVLPPGDEGSIAMLTGEIDKSLAVPK